MLHFSGQFFGSSPQSKRRARATPQLHNDLDYEVLLRSSCHERLKYFSPAGTLIVCSDHMHSTHIQVHFIFYVRVLQRGPDLSFACRAADCMLQQGENKCFFSALLKINVLILLDMVWFGFLIFTDNEDALRSYLRCLCHIEVCVAVHHFICNKLARVGIALLLKYKIWFSNVLFFFFLHPFSQIL